MTITARRSTAAISTGTASLADLLVHDIDERGECEHCQTRTDDLYPRYDFDGSTVEVCETCTPLFIYFED